MADPAIISTVNLSEVACKTVERGFSEAEGRVLLEGLGIQPMAFDLEQAWRAALLRSSTRALGLSPGDRACPALAQSHGIPAVTADKVWLSLEVGISIKSIR